MSSFSDAVDGLIAMYGRDAHGRRHVSLTPRHSDSTGLIDESIDPSDRFLLRMFDVVRRELFSTPISEGTKQRSVSGEIPWRTMHRSY